MTSLDDLDRLAAEAFEGYVVRKDLALRFKGQYPVPTYVGEFLLGRYCATTDPTRSRRARHRRAAMQERTVRAGEEELFKSRARERGRSSSSTDRARLDARRTRTSRSCPACGSTTCASPPTGQGHDRMLTGGFYAEIKLEYDAVIAQERTVGRSRSSRCDRFSCRHAPRSRPSSRGRAHFTLEQWKHFLLRSVGFEPERCSLGREQDILLAAHGPVRRRATTTWSSWGRAAPASRTSSSRSRPTPTSSPAARRRWPACSSTTRPGSAAWSASTTSSASTRSPASPSTRRTASTS